MASAAWAARKGERTVGITLSTGPPSPPDDDFTIDPKVGILALAADAAGALNQTFGTTALTEDLAIGTAQIVGLR